MKNLEHLLHQDESVNRVFTPLPMVSYCSARKLSSYLVCAKIYPLERKEAPISVANIDSHYDGTAVKKATWNG